MVLIGGLSIGLFGSWVLSGVGGFDLLVLGGIVRVFRWWVRFGRVGCFVFVGCVGASSTDLGFAGGLLGIAWLYFFRFGIAFWVWLALRLVWFSVGDL